MPAVEQSMHYWGATHQALQPSILHSVAMSYSITLHHSVTMNEANAVIRHKGLVEISLKSAQADATDVHFTNMQARGTRFTCLLFRLFGCGCVLTRKNMQAIKPITGIQVPNENICATLTPVADNSNIAVSVKYTCMHVKHVKRAGTAANP